MDYLSSNNESSCSPNFRVIDIKQSFQQLLDLLANIGIMSPNIQSKKNRKVCMSHKVYIHTHTHNTEPYKSQFKSCIL